MKTLIIATTLILSSLSATAIGAPALEIRSGNQKQTLEREELEAFPQTTIITKTPYFDGDITYSGPTLKHVIENFGLSGETQITFRALNDYQVSGNLEEVLELDAIITTRINANPLSIRERGPFWIILPLSDRPELDSENHHRFMVWQLQQIYLE